MNISGINSLMYYKDLGKRILLLGETHSTEGMCKQPTKNIVEISKYVKKLADEIPDDECLDLFFEGTYKKIFDTTEDSGLSITRNKLIESSLGDPMRIRVHHTDLRFFSRAIYPVVFFLDSFAKTKSDIPQAFQNLLPENELFNIIDYLLIINQEENRKYFLKLFEIFNESTTDKISENSIKSWEKRYFKTINKELNKLDQSLMTKEILLSYLSVTYRQITDKISSITKDEYAKVMVLLLALPMDVYNLSRMFIRFDNKYRNVCNKPTVDNVIIYTGSLHTIIYEHFFNITFGINPIIRHVNTSIVNLCLSVPEFDFWKD